jgi:hypothetical protein
MVTPHSARHAFISSLQASGTEVGLAAELAGHADPTITLGYYTQAVRGGTQAIDRLDRMYRGHEGAPLFDGRGVVNEEDDPRDRFWSQPRTS